MTQLPILWFQMYKSTNNWKKPHLAPNAINISCLGLTCSLHLHFIFLFHLHLPLNFDIFYLFSLFFSFFLVLFPSQFASQFHLFIAYLSLMWWSARRALLHQMLQPNVGPAAIFSQIASKLCRKLSQRAPCLSKVVTNCLKIVAGNFHRKHQIASGNCHKGHLVCCKLPPNLSVNLHKGHHVYHNIASHWEHRWSQNHSFLQRKFTTKHDSKF